VRGEEARALYEAMRVGATGESVLGTIHGEDPAAVRERVVTDLGVAPSSFASTDVVVVLDDHRVDAIAEVVGRGSEVTFEPLFERSDERLVSTGRIDRGESRLVDGLAAHDESYAAVRDAIGARAVEIKDAAASGRTDPERYVGRESSERKR